MFLLEEDLLYEMSRKVYDGQLSYADIRQKMAKRGFEESQIRLIIRKVDEQVIEYDLQKTAYRTGRNMKYVGLFKIIVSAIIIIGASLGGSIGLLGYFATFSMLSSGIYFYKRGVNNLSPIHERFEFGFRKTQKRLH